MLYDRKDAAGAAAAYKATLKADPKPKVFSNRYYELIMSPSSTATQEEKVAVLSAAIDAGESDAPMYKTLADIYRAHGVYAKAIPLYQKSIQIDPRDPTQLSALAECQMKTGAVQEAW